MYKNFKAGYEEPYNLSTLTCAHMMYTYAMRWFVEACRRNRTLSHNFLYPKTFRFSSRTAHFWPEHKEGQFAPGSRRFPQDNLIYDHVHASRAIQKDLEAIALSERGQDPKVWAALLDLYLPEALRYHQVDLIKDVSEARNIRDIQEVPLILEQARENLLNSPDLLSYLAIHQKRWKAVVWLVKSIMGQHMDMVDAEEDCNERQAPFWADFGMSLDDLTMNDIWADGIIQPLESASFDHDRLSEQPSQSVDVKKASLGQLWQSIACMILHAADRPEGNSETRVIMAHVLQILAQMSNFNAIPDSVYIHRQVEDSVAVQQPPTLNLFSSRIAATLSDMARRAQKLETISKPTHVGAKHSHTSLDLSRDIQQPRSREISISIWLDLVLWSCIEGGWITEAVWIATEIDRRSLDKERSWSVIRWEYLKQQVITQPSMDQITGVSTLAHDGGESFLVNVPPRSISREVILALLDCLTITTNPINSDTNVAEAFSQDISTCKRLLATEGFGIGRYFLNYLMVRLVECNAVMNEPKKLVQILALWPSHSEEIEPISLSQISANSDAHELGIANSAVWISLLHHNLFLFAMSDDIDNTLRCFYEFQCFMDDHCSQLINDFVKKLTIEENSSDSTAETSSSVFLSQIPTHVLDRLLLVVINARLFEFGKWLLYSNEVDGATFPLESYSQPNLQPVLLDFAAATADTQLQVQLTEKLNKPLTTPVLRALLHCQIEFHKWDSVERLFLYLRDHQTALWQHQALMRIARAILLMEKDSSNKSSAQSGSIENAFALLQKFFAGDFKRYEASDSYGTKYIHLRTYNQVFRILKYCSGTLSNLTSPYSESPGRVNSPILIDTLAFNDLVDGVVERDGSAAGKKLWDRWCGNTDREGSASLARFESAVEPNLQTIRRILRPIIEAKRDTEKIQANKIKFRYKLIQTKHGKERDTVNPSVQQNYQKLRYQAKHREIANHRSDCQIVRWACEVFKTHFGFSSKEIRNEFPEELWLQTFPTDSHTAVD